MSARCVTCGGITRVAFYFDHQGEMPACSCPASARVLFYCDGSGQLAPFVEDRAVDIIVAAIAFLSQEERERLFEHELGAHFCMHCGGSPGCRCWDDS